MSWLRRLVRRSESQQDRLRLEDRAHVGFGDTVRVCDTPITREAGLAGLTGIVAGLTTPSAGYAAEVVGEHVADVAVNVRFPDDAPRWFSPELLELVDHTAGLTLGIAGVEFERTERGEWRPSKE